MNVCINSSNQGPLPLVREGKRQCPWEEGGMGGLTPIPRCGCEEEGCQVLQHKKNISARWGTFGRRTEEVSSLLRYGWCMWKRTQEDDMSGTIPASYSPRNQRLWKKPKLGSYITPMWRICLATEYLSFIKIWSQHPLKYKYTNTQIQIHKHKFTTTNTQIQLHRYKYTNTNSVIQIHK